MREYVTFLLIQGAGLAVGENGCTMVDGRWAAEMGIAAVLILSLAGSAAAAATGAEVVVSQWCRSFRPQTVTVRQGEALDIVNDDGMTVHHAYIDDPDLSYDAGEQNPGNRTRIVFAQAGTFTMLCGIHPKMRLSVTVKE